MWIGDVYRNLGFGLVKWLLLLLLVVLVEWLVRVTLMILVVMTMMVVILSG